MATEFRDAQERAIHEVADLPLWFIVMSGVLRRASAQIRRTCGVSTDLVQAFLPIEVIDNSMV
jgi:hypothetical protein